MNTQEIRNYKAKKAIEYAQTKDVENLSELIEAFIKGCDCMMEYLRPENTGDTTFEQWSLIVVEVLKEKGYIVDKIDPELFRDDYNNNLSAEDAVTNFLSQLPEPDEDFMQESK